MVPLFKARELALQAGLDLVLVSDRSVPPVVRIMDYGKLQYEQKKSQKIQRKNNAAAQKSKEVKFHINVDTNDYDLKIRRSLDFLEKGYKLKITLQLRGREMAHPELAYELMEKIMAEIAPHGEPDTLKPKLIGRTIMVGYSPK